MQRFRKFTTQRTFILTLLGNGCNVNEQGTGNPRSTSTTKVTNGCELGLSSRLGEQLVQVRMGIRGVAQDTFRENPSLLLLGGMLTFNCHLLSLSLLSMALSSTFLFLFLSSPLLSLLKHRASSWISLCGLRLDEMTCECWQRLVLQ